MRNLRQKNKGSMSQKISSMFSYDEKLILSAITRYWHTAGILVIKLKHGLLLGSFDMIINDVFLSSVHGSVKT